ncbi:hypothetical protein N7491_003247 [Penicillium cf. griseofulvum]|uniref:Uncharacterized protein n=1 Tax=Penicillium cf. griseofulvum TaxID=2972120 RepID=A0A9W9T1M7_9EURO|nr:hypothetical protein N7472_002582 [Penicillium cf. griseofulvum]KAJ5440841.1 hypothetical protein N7491_003247 [Penicillium cf. griseofulvum]KAJ5448885.1 hypothetical protein N7445_003706 [Penicillium cf. griseofulvum]
MAQTYFDIPAIDILAWQFPVEQGYITRPQDRHSSQSGRKGFSDLHTYQYPSGGGRANKFLIVQCKRKGLETRDSVWLDAVGQLNQYLSASHGSRHTNPTPVYGIVAIGMYMRAYKYNDMTRTVDDFSLPGQSSDQPFDIKKDRAVVQRILDIIKEDH